MPEEEEQGDAAETGQLSISMSGVNIKQPREITQTDVDMALEAYKRFVEISHDSNDVGHYR